MQILKYWSIVIALIAVNAFSQERTASINGTVKDPSGAPVPAAKITIRNTETGFKRDVSTSGNGDYAITSLDPGTYQITAEHAGFKTMERSGIVLHVNDNVRIDYSLSLGEVNQVVNVSEEAPLLRTSDASLGQVVDNQKVTGLPLNGRSSFRLVELTPGYIASPGASGQF